MFRSGVTQSSDMVHIWRCQIAIVFAVKNLSAISGAFQGGSLTRPSRSILSDKYCRFFGLRAPSTAGVIGTSRYWVSPALRGAVRSDRRYRKRTNARGRTCNRLSAHFRVSALIEKKDANRGTIFYPRSSRSSAASRDFLRAGFFEAVLSADPFASLHSQILWRGPPQQFHKFPLHEFSGLNIWSKGQLWKYFLIWP